MNPDAELITHFMASILCHFTHLSICLTASSSDSSKPCFPLHLHGDQLRKEQAIRTCRRQHEDVGVGPLAVEALVMFDLVALVLKGLPNGFLEPIRVPVLDPVAKRRGGHLEGVFDCCSGQLLLGIRGQVAWDLQ